MNQIVDHRGEPITASVENPNVPLSQALTLIDGGGTSSGVTVTEKTAMGYPPFWRAVNLLSNDVASLPIVTYRRGEGDSKEKDPSHPVSMLLGKNGKPSPTTRSLTFKRTVMSHTLIYGNGYAYIERDGNGTPRQLILLDPRGVSVLQEFGTENYAYNIQVNDRNIWVDPYNVLHISGLGRDGICGYSVIDLLADALGVGMAAQTFGGKFFSQGGNASGLLMVPGHFSPEQINNLRKSWAKQYEGLSKAHKVALLQDGAQFKQLTIPPEAGQFLQTRDYEVRATVANILGIPPHKLGDSSRTSYSSLESENASYLQSALMPWLAEWESEITDKLISPIERRTDSVVVEFNTASLLRADLSARVASYRTMIEIGGLTVNEMRARENLSNIGEDGDIRYRPANWEEVGAEPEPAPAPAPPVQPEPVKEPEETEATALLTRMIEAAVDKSLGIQRQRILKAAGGDENFVDWLRTFTNAQKELMQVPGLDISEPADFWCEAVFDGCLTAAGYATKTTLAAQLGQYMDADWPGLRSQLINSILESVK